MDFKYNGNGASLQIFLFEQSTHQGRDIGHFDHLETFRADGRAQDGLSADMDDILTEEGQKQAVDWLEFTLWKMERGEFKRPITLTAPVREPKLATVPMAIPHSGARKAVIVTDLLPEDAALKAMIDRFTAVFPYECDVINIEDLPFMGGCLSCFSCAATGKCVYKDGFDDFLQDKD